MKSTLYVNISEVEKVPKDNTHSAAELLLSLAKIGYAR